MTDRGQQDANTGHSPHSERRLITCLFVDVVGSTDASMRIGPERMKRSLDRMFVRIRDVAESRGGTVEKYIGDAVFVLFGAPTAHADDAGRALSASLDIVAATDRIGNEEPFALRLGVETGEALVDLNATGADRQRMAVGACVNIAARLQALADPGSILVGPVARSAGGAAFLYEGLGTKELKGIGPVETARLVGIGLVADARADFVGRKEELAALEAAFARAVAGNATFALITGPPGQGKSRLLAEFVSRLGGQAIVFDARCRPGTESGAQNPLRQLLEPTLRDGDLPEAISMLTAAMGGGPEAIEAANAIAHSAGIANDSRLLGLSRIEREARFVDAWARYLGTMARPVVAVIEDLHWAEPQLLRFLDHITGKSVPVLLLATTRPELAGRMTWRQGGERVFIDLEPFNENDARELVLGRRSLDQAAIARSGGNPLFLLELIDAKAPGDTGLPLSLEAAIGARLDELAAPERQLIQRAAVAGETFSVVDAALLAEREPAEVAAVLGRLAQLRFLDQLNGAFRFYHPLAHEVAYNRLPVEERMRLHARYAEEGIAPADAEGRAHHWWEALRPPDADWVWEGDPDLGRMRHDACTVHLEAASRYSDRASHERAILVLERGLTLATTSADQAAAHNALARAYARNGEGNASWSARLQAIGVHEATGGDAPASFYADAIELTSFHWGYFHVLPDEGAVRDLAARGLAAAVRSGDDVSRARLTVQQAMLRPDLGKPDDLVEEIVAARDPLASADLLQRLALVQMQRGDIRLAVATYQRVDELVARGATINQIERAWWGGVTSYAAGDLQDLADHAARLTAITAGQSVHSQGHALGTTARLLLARGQWDELAAIGQEISALVEENPAAAFCIAPAGGAAFGAVARLMRGGRLDPELPQLMARLVPESTDVQEALLLLPAAVAGDPIVSALSRRAFAPGRVWDREITDPTWTTLAIVLALAGDQRGLAREVTRLRAAEAAGGKLAGAIADALVGGPKAGADTGSAHASLRALGYVGLSEIIARAPR